MAPQAYPLTLAQIKRYWSLVAVTDDADSCWEWTGAKGSHGYGVLPSGDKTGFLAHRVAYQLQNGLIPIGHFVCHKCDNHGCQRGSHLFTGTDSDNIQDAIRKGRVPTGEQVRNTTLSNEQARQIKQERAELGTPYGKLGRKYGISPATARNIAIGHTWRHI